MLKKIIPERRLEVGRLKLHCFLGIDADDRRLDMVGHGGKGFAQLLGRSNDGFGNGARRRRSVRLKFGGCDADEQAGCKEQAEPDCDARGLDWFGQFHGNLLKQYANKDVAILSVLPAG
jgi:hypothetical protein